MCFTSDTPHHQIQTGSGLSESSPKNADVPKSPLYTVAALVPSAGTKALHIELRSDAGVVSIRSGRCVSARFAAGVPVAEGIEFNMQCQRTLTRLTLFGAALLFVLVLPQTSRAQSTDRVGLVERLQGDVSIVHFGNSTKATQGMAISLKDQLVTGADARLQIMLAETTRRSRLARTPRR